MFSLLPTELQLQVYEASLESLDKPRIVQVDITTTTPCFNPSRPDRGVTLGWDLTVPNHAALARTNPYAMAHNIARADTTRGRRAADAFLAARGRRPWDPPRYAAALAAPGLDLSLASDVLWLPRDVLDFVTKRSCFPAVCRDFAGDEGRARRVMVDVDTLRREVVCARDEVWGCAAEGREAALVALVECFPACEEVVVLVGAEGGVEGRAHLEWDEVLYVPAEEAYQHLDDKEPWRYADGFKAMCIDLWDKYYDFVQREGLEWPELSFAFVKKAS